MPYGTGSSLWGFAQVVRRLNDGHGMSSYRVALARIPSCPLKSASPLLIALFAAGYIARRRGWLQPPHAGKMLQLVITIGLPALFIADVSRIPLQRELIALPVSGVLIIVVTLCLSLLLGRALGLPRRRPGRR